MAERCKIAFHLEPRTLGTQQTSWPPGEVETIWAEWESDHRATILNIPLFAKGVSFLDSVNVIKSPDNPFLTVTSVARHSGHGTVRAILIADEGKGIAEQALDEIEALGCEFESGDAVVGIDIPPGVSFEAVLSTLEVARASGAIYVDIGYLPQQGIR